MFLFFFPSVGGAVGGERVDTSHTDQDTGRIFLEGEPQPPVSKL